MSKKDEISKSRISRDDVENFIDVLWEKLNTKLPDRSFVDDAIREAADKVFDVREITANKIKGF